MGELAIKRTQDQRSQDMRRLLCEVTLEVICDVGYERVSTALIARRANVSRGAQSHHFASKTDLLVGAFQYLLKLWEIEGIQFEASQPKPIGVEAYIRYLWRVVFGHPHYIAAIELMLAARGDNILRDKLQSVLNDWIEIRDTMFHEAVGLSIDREQTALFFQMNLCAMRGMAIHASFNRAPSSNEVLLEYWIETAKRML